MQTKNLVRFIGLFTLLAAFGFSGCKGQQEMKQQIGELENKLADSQRRVTTMEGELKKANFEISQIKTVVTNLGNVTVELKKAEEDRQKAVTEAKSRAESGKKGKVVVKKPSATPAAKKHH